LAIDTTSPQVGLEEGPGRQVAGALRVGQLGTTAWRKLFRGVRGQGRRRLAAGVDRPAQPLLVLAGQQAVPADLVQVDAQQVGIGGRCRGTCRHDSAPPCS
jgi:hypothetical protein